MDSFKESGRVDSWTFVADDNSKQEKFESQLK